MLLRSAAPCHTLLICDILSAARRPSRSGAGGRDTSAVPELPKKRSPAFSTRAKIGQQRWKPWEIELIKRAPCDGDVIQHPGKKRARKKQGLRVEVAAIKMF